MPLLDLSIREWVLSRAGPGTSIVDVRGLHDGGSPWMLRLVRDSQDWSVVLRAGSAASPEPLRTEVTALRVAAECGIQAPRLIAADVDRDPPLVLTEAVAGRSTIPRQRPVNRLRTLGAFAAALHRVQVPPDTGLPTRDRPVALVDFSALRRSHRHPTSPLLGRAEELVAARSPVSAHGLVHGDLWQGNTLWDGDRLVAVVDWECAGTGPAGVDLGWLRFDAALCFGLEAADEVLGGWQAAAGRVAEDLAYWDAVAALSTAPDMGWDAQAIGAQGRTDLSPTLLLDRRDDFLAVALAGLDS